MSKQSYNLSNNKGDNWTLEVLDSKGAYVFSYTIFKLSAKTWQANGNTFNNKLLEGSSFGEVVGKLIDGEES